MRWYIILSAIVLTSWPCLGSNIFMMTMGGTKSHKIPFWELARALIAKNHTVTFVSAFPPDFHMPGLEEITPAGLVFYVRNYTNYDLVGRKMRGEEPLLYKDIIRYPHEVCTALYEDQETKDLIYSNRHYDLIMLDGAFPECSLGIVNHMKVPFMYINMVGFYMTSISISGNPVPFAITPFFYRAFIDRMDIIDRVANTFWHTVAKVMHWLAMSLVQQVLIKNFGPNMPHYNEISKNVSFILQNGHYSVTYPRPYLPNVAEIACIHCKPPKPLNKELEDFIDRGKSGFIFVSMGSSVKTSNMPEELRRLLVKTFTRLPYQVLWKWEVDAKDMDDLPPNVMLNRWLPQQDLLGHKKIRAFVTHGGLLSMFETVYHGVPVVTMPVFCDHEVNAAKAVLDGYAIKLEFHTLTSEALLSAIIKLIHDPKYKENLKKRQLLFKDQKETPLERAVYWTEYVIRHKGAYHLQSPGKDLNVVQYYSVDTISILIISVALLLYTIYLIVKSLLRYFIDYLKISKKIKSN